MNLLRWNEEHNKLSLARYASDDIPPYAILSHTWGSDQDELSYQDVQDQVGQNKAGFAKVRFCGWQAQRDGLEYFWVDTCCIDKRSSAEVSESIISMFRWYERSSACYVYLADVPNRDLEAKQAWQAQFQASRWFTRGWTLQELLAPSSVKFYSNDEKMLGSKATLEAHIHAVTSIPVSALRGIDLAGFSVEDRLSWSEGRKTTRKEDKAYCLLGIFKVVVVPLYGEEENAFTRLHDAIDQRWGRPNVSINTREARTAWRRSDETRIDPEIERRKKRKRLVDSLTFAQMGSRLATITDADHTTCQWLLNHTAYVSWINPMKMPGDEDILWVYGKPGVGKSTLLKYVLHANSRWGHSQHEILIAFFFDARGSELERTTKGMYRSLISQLLVQKPELEIILDDIDVPNQKYESSLWTIERLQSTFKSAIRNLENKRLICIVDALDECEECQARDMVSVFEGIVKTAVNRSNQLCICFASRHYPSIQSKGSLKIVIENESDHERALAKMIRSKFIAGDGEDYERIRAKIQVKSNGTFLWAVLMIDMLNKVYSDGRMWEVERKLEDTPGHLGALYTTIIRRSSSSMDELLLCLQWLLFAKAPLTVPEFYHAMMAKVEHSSSLPWPPAKLSHDDMKRFVIACSRGLAEITKSESPTVQFVHESVRDYLLDGGGLATHWPHLSTTPIASSHCRLRDCCQWYLTIDYHQYFPRASSQVRTRLDQSRFIRDFRSQYPFMAYAAEWVFHHAEHAATSFPQQEFLISFPLIQWRTLAEILQLAPVYQNATNLTLLYHLCWMNCPRLIGSLPSYTLWERVDGTRHIFPVIAAFDSGAREVFSVLFDICDSMASESIARDPEFGARRCRNVCNFNDDPIRWAVMRQNWNLAIILSTTCLSESMPMSKESWGTSAALDFVLLWATMYNVVWALKLLLDRGASPNASIEIAALTAPQAIHGDNASGTQMIVRKSKAGVPVALRKVEANTGLVGRRWSALVIAIENNNAQIVQILLAAGARCDLPLSSQVFPLHHACALGYDTIIHTLLSAGADVNSEPGNYGTPLAIAAHHVHSTTVGLLLQAGAQAGEHREIFTEALYNACRCASDYCIRVSAHVGADMNARSSRGYAFEASFEAYTRFDRRTVHLLLDAGMSIDLRGDRYGSVLQGACYVEDTLTVQWLISQGVDVNAYGGPHGNALHAGAICLRDCEQETIVRILLNAGADVNAWGHVYGRALQSALAKIRPAIAKLLLEAGVLNP